MYSTIYFNFFKCTVFENGSQVQAVLLLACPILIEV